jgi:hypothetical protein
VTTHLQLDERVDHAPDEAEVPASGDGVSVVTRALSWAPICLVVLLMAILLRYSALYLNNFDTWFHLTLGDRFRTGEWSLSHPGGLTSFATSPWVATQWSTEVLASLFEHWFGLPGVAWLFGAFYLALVLTVYVVCRKRSRPVPAAIVTAMVIFGSAPAISARPQVVSLVLLAVTVHAWLKTWDDQRIRWWLIPLTWVWATAHGLWSAGILVGAVCCVGILLDRRVSFRRALALACVPIGSLLVTALTPVGPRLLTSQFAVSARSSMIAEWGPTSFRELPALVVAAMIAWLVVLWARRGSVSWTPLLLLLMAAGWTLLVVRMVALGAIVVAPLLVQALDSRLPVRSTSPSRRGERRVLAAAAVGYLVVLGIAVTHTATEPADVPSGMLPKLRALPAGSPVVVDDGAGAWMEWAVPDVDPVIDGMLDAYPVDYIEDFTAFKAVKPGWQKFLADSHAQVAVLQKDSSVSAAMQDQLHWKVAQQDADWVYLVAPDAR